MFLGGGDAVLDAQVGMNGTGQRQEVRDGYTADLAELIDATPRFVAGLVLGAALTLLLLRVAGFRFSFGASIGGS